MSNQAGSPKGLYRDKEHARIAGVCAGIADYLGVRVNVVRVITVIAGVIYTVPVVTAYLLGAWLLKPRPDNLYRDAEEETFWRSLRRSPRDTLSEVRLKFRQMDRRLQSLEAHVTSNKFRLDREFERMEK